MKHIIESMQVVALSRTLQKCSHQPSAVIGGIGSTKHLISSPSPSTRACHTTRIQYATKQSHVRTKSAGKELAKPSHTTVDHPLSVESLRNLAPGVRHMFESRSSSPYFNLAVEHHLLTYSHPSSQILFTYANRPCVVVGRNQNPWVECNLAAIGKAAPDDGPTVELVRRRSGGGTVFHDRGNLNYTVIVPSEGFERRTHVQMIVDALMNKFQDAMIESRRWEEVKVNERNDIVAKLREQFKGEQAEVEWLKVSGTAFKLTRGRALHHGTLLHSSPFVNSIGSLLRSPGKEYITAKGVESVRSPVTNLYTIRQRRDREQAKRMITRAIQVVWLKRDSPDTVVEGVKPIRILDDNIEKLVPELKSGIEELQTSAWKWDQTPGFSFSSKNPITSNNVAPLEFEVKNGIIQAVKTLPELQSIYEENLLQHKIHELSQRGKWRAALENDVLSQISQKSLIELVEKCFPPLETTGLDKGKVGSKSLPLTAATSVDQKQKKKKITKRKRKDGAVEIEVEGTNTVVETVA